LLCAGGIRGSIPRRPQAPERFYRTAPQSRVIRRGCPDEYILSDLGTEVREGLGGSALLLEGAVRDAVCQEGGSALAVRGIGIRAAFSYSSERLDGCISQLRPLASGINNPLHAVLTAEVREDPNGLLGHTVLRVAQCAPQVLGGGHSEAREAARGYSPDLAVGIRSDELAEHSDGGLQARFLERVDSAQPGLLPAALGETDQAVNIHRLLCRRKGAHSSVTNRRIRIPRCLL